MYINADDKRSAYYDIYLDGVKIDRCYSADVDLGWVEVYANPPVVWDPLLGHSVRNLVKKYGRVELVNKITGSVIR